MIKHIQTCIFIISIFFLLTEASKKGGKNKSGGWNTGNNRNPSYPGNTGNNWNTGQNWGHNYNPSGGHNYNNKQFKPPKAKTNMKMVAGAAAVGAVGGFMLGNAVGNMRYHFNNDDEYRYYQRYQNEMPNRVYRPIYDDQTGVSREKFISDCYEMTVTEYIIKEDEGKNTSDVNNLENRVKRQMIREMCISEYRNGSGLKLFLSPWLVMSISIFVYFVVQ